LKNSCNMKKSQAFNHNYGIEVIFNIISMRVNRGLS
jgi:hypothetical protein